MVRVPIRCAFISTGLEPGRDGVGDYSRGLAAELELQGHSACLLALNDRLIETELYGEQIESRVQLPCLRLPAAIPWKAKIQCASDYLQQFLPQWVSLQFVCYGYHRKGLVYGLADRLQPLLQGRGIHVMFHETWIGEEKDASLKTRIIGLTQRHFLLAWLRKIKPSVVHTSNETYAHLLINHGVSARVLPLFGNIPVMTLPTSWVDDELSRYGITPQNRDQFWLFGFFGGIPAEWFPGGLCQAIRALSKQTGKNIAFLAIGRHGHVSDGKLNELTELLPTARIIKFGEQPSHRISEFLQSIDFGIATSTLLLIGKSGSAAAMLEHGLPVIVTRIAEELRSASVLSKACDPRLILLDERFPERMLNAKRTPLESQRSAIARQFLRDLNAVTRIGL